MPSPYADLKRRWAPMCFIVLCALGPLGCGEEGNWLVLQIEGVTSDVRQLRVRLQLNGADHSLHDSVAAPPSVAVPPKDNRQIALRLPDGFSDMAKVTLDGIPAFLSGNDPTDRRFVRSQGIVQVAVSGDGRTNAPIKLEDRGADEGFLPGLRWVPLGGPSARPLINVWAFSDKDAWALPERGPAWHWDGVAWEAQTDMPRNPTPTSVFRFDDLWAFTPTDVWFLDGQQRTILRRLGGGSSSSWVLIPIKDTNLNDIFSIAGFSPDRVWALGSNSGTGNLSVYRGGTGNWVSESVPGMFPSEWGDLWAGGSQVWAIGAQCTVLYRDNAMSDATGDMTWKSKPPKCTTDVNNRKGLRGVWGTGSGEIYVVGDYGGIFHLKDGTWGDESISSGPNLFTVHGTSSGHVFAVADTGEIYQRPPDLPLEGWKAMPTHSNGPLYGVFALSDTQVLAVGAGGTIFSNVTGSSPAVPDTGGLPNIMALAGTGPTDLWASQQHGILHFDGDAWTPSILLSGQIVSALWATGPNDVWASASGTLYRYSQEQNGQEPKWSLWKDGPSMRVNALWGSGPNDVWAVGEGGKASHWTGSSWSLPMDTGAGANLTAISGSAPNYVWAVGGGNSMIVVAMYDGKWQDAKPNLIPHDPSPANSVWVQGKNVYVGGYSVIGRYDGTAWRMPWKEAMVVQAATVYCLWGSAPDDIWIGGASYGIGRYSGQFNNDNPVSVAYGDFGGGTRGHQGVNLHAIFGTPANSNSIFFGGDYGALLRYQP